ncbi:MAG: protein kinase domain-containing protein [Steroidobacter sp.]
MAATILDSTFPPEERPPEWTPPTADLDSTADLQEESTSDLVPGADVDMPECLVGESLFETRDNEADLEPGESRMTPGQTTHAGGAAREGAIAPGTVLNDRYLLEAVIGCGGAAIVYRARDMHSGQGAKCNAHIAIKTPRPELHDHARASARITHEYQHTRALSHPNIVRVFDLYTERQPSFMTMEFIEGKVLSTLLRDRNPLPAPLAHTILQGCAQALAHAHGRNVVHGDFKPGNVFVTRSRSVKVIDFGAAATPATAESRIAAGTPAYASPEVLSGETPEARDDVFSFACVAYELLTGQHPFDRRSSLQAREEGRTPPRAWTLSASQWLSLLSALSWSREQRPRDIEALVVSLAPEPQQQSANLYSTDPDHRNLTAVDLPEDLVPRQRSWGFFVFIACALAVTYVTSQRQSEQELPEIALAPASIPQSLGGPMAPAGILAAVVRDASSTGASLPQSPLGRPEAAPTHPNDAYRSGAGSAIETPAPAETSKPRPAALSEISFESDRIVTSEGSVAAVFLIKRSQPLRGRIRIQWNAVSGSADAGIDFASNASGSVEFADGQAQRAIYVPLRNDLLKEEDETFTIRLQSPHNARVGKANSIEATIRDDD